MSSERTSSFLRSLASSFEVDGYSRYIVHWDLRASMASQCGNRPRSARHDFWRPVAELG